MEKRVFVSYSHKDAKWANEVVQGFETLGFKVWKDDWYETAHAELESGIAAGADWTLEIEKAIASCQGFVGLVSDNSRKSKWCKKELLFAEQQPGHTNIIIRYREYTKLPDGMNYAYTDNSHIVWSETDTGSFWKSIEANKEFMAIREGAGTVGEIQSPMVKRINKHLETDWERHKSFLLMKNLDRSLLPTGNFIRNQDRMVVNEDDERIPFADFIKESWNKQTHLFIEGTGGVGKSVSLLTFATEPRFLPVNVAAVYIPLNRLSDKQHFGTDCIDKFLTRKLADDEFDWIEKHSKGEWNGKPNVILLLDGYNEVPPDKRSDVDHSIDDWSERSGVQIVTTSRFNASFSNKCFKRIRLLELDRSTVAIFLSSNGMEFPEETSKIWGVINTPLMLKIYVEVASIAKDVNKDYLSFKKSDSAGNLIWNYTLKEVDKCIGNKGSYEAIEYAMAILLVAPYTCWKMERSYQFTIDEDQWSQYVDEGVEYWSGREYSAYFKKIEDSLDSYAEELKPRKQKAHIKKIFTEITSVFNKTREEISKTIYALVHQNFRDGLAAMHMNNIVMTSNGKLPDEFKDSLSEYVVDCLADIMEDDAIQGVWEGNRKHQPTHIVATHNLLRLVHKKRDGSLASLDWSGMDVGEINLFRYRKGLRMDLSKKSECFANTRISVNCFKPEGHTGPVRCVVYSPKGRQIVSCSDDKTIRIWDAETLQQIEEPLEGHEGEVYSLTYSSDSLRIVSGDSKGTICIWDAETHQQIGEPLKGHKDAVYSLTYSPDSRCIVSCSGERFWRSMAWKSLLDPEPIHLFQDTIHFWNAETHKPMPLEGYRSEVYSHSYSLDNRPIADCSGKHFLGQYVEGDILGKNLFDPDTTHLFEDTIHILDLDVETHKPVPRSLERYCGEICSYVYSPDGLRIASGDSKGTICIWDVETLQQIGEPLKGHKGAVYSLAYSPDGLRIASGDSKGMICIWDAETLRQIGGPLEGHEGEVCSLAYSPDSRRITSCSNDKTICIWDAETHRQIRKLSEGFLGSVYSLAYSPDGRYIASCSNDKTIRIWDAETHRQIKEPLEGHEGCINCIAFSPDGRYIASCSDDKTILIWDAETYRQIGEPLEGHEREVYSLAYSPDGRCIASSDVRGKICIWDAETHEIITESCEKTILIRSMQQIVKTQKKFAYNPDGHCIACGDSHGKICIWDTEMHQQIDKPLDGQKSEINALTYSLDGRCIACGDGRGMICIWDVETHQQIGRPLEGHEDVINALVYSPTGRQIASCSEDGTIRVWDADTHECIDTIEPLFGIDLSGLDFSFADIDEKSKKILYQNGVEVGRN